MTALIMAGSTLFGPGIAVEAATGTIQDVKHVVIFMQENRAFDHYFGSLSGVRGFADPNAVIQTNGHTVFYQWDGWEYILPIYTNSQCLGSFVNSWDEPHAEWNGGKWDRWIPVAWIYPMAYYMRSDLPFYYALAEAYTVCDAWFCSVLGTTLPNRLYLMTGTLDPTGAYGGPGTDNASVTNGFHWTTYPERLQAAGITWKVYQQGSDFIGINALTWFNQYKNLSPGNPLYDRGVALVSDLLGALRSDVTNNTLPQVSWIIPPWSDSEHPCFAPSVGEQLTAEIIAALGANPAVWNSTVLIFTYDENGGFFDHVVPPTPTPGTADEFVKGQPIGPGVRVPTIVVSPWSRGGYVCSQVFDHTSIIRFLEQWTGVQEPNISAWRRAVCGDLTAAFDFSKPNTNQVTLPAVVGYICTNCVGPVWSPGQPFPLQEPGTRPARPLPYQPNAFAVADPLTSQFSIIMANAGIVSFHFAIYANAYRGDGPWQFDVAPGKSAIWSAYVPANGAYDFSCYGANGFNRRFAGNFSTNCCRVEVIPSIEPSSGSMTLALKNSTLSSVTFTLTNAFQPGTQSVYVVPAGSTAHASFTNANRWYDISARTDQEAAFLRRLAGRVELPMAVSKLIATAAGTNLVLTWPGYVTNTLESTTNLFPTAWSPVNASPVLIESNAALTIPFTGRPMFFRLRP